MLQGGAVGNVPEETLASYAQPLQTELPTWRPEFTEEVDEATRRRFGRGPTISPRKDRFDKVLDAIDGLFAGFANALTFGGSNYLRAAMWGQTATQNHQGIAYNIGMGVGVGVSFALGYGLGRGAAMGAWAAKGIRGYMIAGDVVGVAQSSYNAVTGQFSPMDTLGFVPTIGWGMGAMGRYAGVRAASPGAYGRTGKFTPSEDVVDFANRWDTELDAAAANRMRRVGVPEEMIGLSDTPFGRALETRAAQGGGNLHPDWSGVSHPQLNVDIAVLDARLNASSPTWARASWKDRIDAVVAHEYAEVLYRHPDMAVRHSHAIQHAAETQLRITDRARQILMEDALYRTR